VAVTAVAENPVVRRYGWVGRWFHAGIYVTVLLALGTGWWFVLVGYERASPLARLTGRPDGEVHELSGYAMILVFLVWLPFGLRGLRSFIRETTRFERGDGRWLLGWPRAVFTGRFGNHSGHFDPGQRLANIVIVVLLTVVVVTGLGAIFGPSSGLRGVMFDVHRWASYAVTPVLLGHIVVAAGILPGYRGVWRSMHLGGRLPVGVARRIWPTWLDETQSRESDRARRS
jgi:cytochrome b subunit of formate dehydrogenase